MKRQQQSTAEKGQCRWLWNLGNGPGAWIVGVAEIWRRWLMSQIRIGLRSRINRADVPTVPSEPIKLPVYNLAAVSSNERAIHKGSIGKRICVERPVTDGNRYGRDVGALGIKHAVQAGSEIRIVKSSREVGGQPFGVGETGRQGGQDGSQLP